MNETIKNLMERRSVREYKDEPIPAETLNLILRAGSFAPSGMGRQPVIMAAVTNREVRDHLSKLNAAVMGIDGDPFYGAPTVIAVLADKTVPTYLYDGALVMGNLLNAAHACGIDSCWIHRAKEVFDSEEGKKLLKSWGIADSYEGIGNCILGCRSGSRPEAAPRKDNNIIIVR